MSAEMPYGKSTGVLVSLTLTSLTACTSNSDLLYGIIVKFHQFEESGFEALYRVLSAEEPILLLLRLESQIDRQKSCKCEEWDCNTTNPQLDIGLVEVIVCPEKQKGYGKNGSGNRDSPPHQIVCGTGVVTHHVQFLCRIELQHILVSDSQALQPAVTALATVGSCP